MIHILFVEDDKAYRKTLTNILTGAGYHVDAIANPFDAIEKASNKKYDLVISDYVMKDLDGLQFLKIIKRINPDAKTMILTGQPSMDGESAALDIAIDCYLEKSKRTDVFLKYIEKLLYNDNDPQELSYILHSKVDNIELDPISRTIKKNGKEVKVTPKQFAITHLLLKNKGRAISREEILEAVWDTPLEVVEARIVDVHIKEIRRKLNLQSIVSIRGFGYKWEE